MNDAQALQIWFWGLAAAGVVVLIAASLLIAIWRTAVAIEGLAGSALETARQIVDNTAPIWRLHEVKDTTARILDRCQSVERRGGALAAALTAHAGPGGASSGAGDRPRPVGGGGGGERP